MARGQATIGIVLGPLQQRVARIVAGLPEARAVALAGGAALLVHGLSERPTNDLDFFTTDPTEIAALAAAVEAALQREGLTVEVLRRRDTFVRLSVRDADHVTLVDLAWDARLRPPVASDVGPVLDEEELAADKLLALFSRAEPRDFLDVYHLSERFGLDRILQLAQQKDAGLSAPRLAESLGHFDRLDQADFGLDTDGYRALRRWVTSIQRQLLGRRPPEPPGLGL